MAPFAAAKVLVPGGSVLAVLSRAETRCPNVTTALNDRDGRRSGTNDSAASAD